MTDRSALRDAVLGIIEAGEEVSEERFNELALALFAYQFRNGRIYRAYCEKRGRLPDNVGDYSAIPAVPTDAFKAAPLLCGDPADATHLFRTSGTTLGAGRRGEHHFLDVDIYRAALRTSFRRHLLPDRSRMRIISLVPSASEATDSSLSFMVSDLIQTFGERATTAVGLDGIDLAAFLRAAQEAIDSAQPVIVIGTSFSFVHLLDALRADQADLRLPEGSRAMDTGGFKGRSREVPREELYGAIERGLGIPAHSIVNEYGMTEMSSQFYDGTVSRAAPVDQRRHTRPAWVRTISCDPETLEPLPEGSVGILRHLDLANVDSVMALQTADMGRVEGGRIELLGRAAGSEPRGCSIAMDDLLGGVDR